MIVDKSEAGKVYSDLLGRHTEPVTLDDKGGAEFYVDDATASVWINQDYIDQINQVNE